MTFFPIISDFKNDIEPHIRGNECFKHYVKDGGYSVVDYNFAFGDTFGDPLTERGKALLECRGLIFDSHGKLLSRPLHKFFNLGENKHVSIENIKKRMNRQRFEILEKMDGSMIRAFMLSGEVRLGTRAGITDVSVMAEEFVKKSKIDYMGFCKDICGRGFTPIFEFCGKNNRIVVQYSEETMTLIAIRDNLTGEYMRLGLCQFEATIKLFSIPVVVSIFSKNHGFQSELGFDEWLDDVRNSTDDIEGFVIRFEDGSMVKVKTDQYCLLHRTIDDTSRLNDLLPLVIDGKIDDLIPRLPEHKKDSVIAFAVAYQNARARLISELTTLTNEMIENHSESQKSMALFLTRKENHLSAFNSIMFNRIKNDWSLDLGDLIDDFSKKMCCGNREKCVNFVKNQLQIEIDNL